MSKKKDLVFHPDTSNVVPVRFEFNRSPSDAAKYCCDNRNIGSEIFEEHFHVCLACLTAYSNDEKRVAEKNNPKPNPCTEAALKALEYRRGVKPAAQLGIPLTDEEVVELKFWVRTSQEGSVRGKLEFLRAYR